MSPSDLTPKRHLALKRSGVYADVEKLLRGMGYRGKWHLKSGQVGLFSKRLMSVAGVREEVRQLQSISFKDLLADVGHGPAKRR